MHGFVAVTNPGWCERLSRTPEPKDANFWRPSTRRFHLEIGTPFFFKLKAPYDAIAGFGYFAGFSVLPDWLAWDTFDTANGVDSLEELQSRLAGIQAGARIQADPRGLIGCALIAEAEVFPRDRWVRTPSDWKPRTQTGETYDLSQGEGQRIWLECLARAGGARADEEVLVFHQPERYGTPVLHRPRLGQQIFRINVLDAYGRSCAVSGEHSLPVLEAVHIKPYANGGEHAVSNGLSLRSDIHRLFDRGYVTVDEDLRLVVSHRLKEDFDNGRSYLDFNGQALGLPRDSSARPSGPALEWHRETVYLG